jgi:hypothetical protein
MTAISVKACPNGQQAESATEKLNPPIFTAFPMAPEFLEGDVAYRNASWKFKVSTWVAAVAVSIMLWWMAVKLVLTGWNLMAL